MAKEDAKGKVAISDIKGNAGIKPRAGLKSATPKDKIRGTKSKARPKLAMPNDINVCW